MSHLIFVNSLNTVLTTGGIAIFQLDYVNMFWFESQTNITTDKEGIFTFIVIFKGAYHFGTGGNSLALKYVI
jgi:hypothetical protein